MHTVQIHESAVQRYDEACAAIRDAHLWAENLTDFYSPDDGEMRDELYRRRVAVSEMQRSFFQSIANLAMRQTEHDGTLRLCSDSSPFSFFWAHEKSGYHGGLIFHANHRDGERLPVGTWSIHT